MLAMKQDKEISEKRLFHVQLNTQVTERGSLHVC